MFSAFILEKRFSSYSAIFGWRTSKDFLLKLLVRVEYVSEMALESLCGLSVRGKLLRPDPFDLDVAGINFKTEMLGLQSEPEFLVQPPFVSYLHLALGCAANCGLRCLFDQPSLESVPEDLSSNPCFD